MMVKKDKMESEEEVFLDHCLHILVEEKEAANVKQVSRRPCCQLNGTPNLLMALFTLSNSVLLFPLPPLRLLALSCIRGLLNRCSGTQEIANVYRIGRLFEKIQQTIRRVFVVAVEKSARLRLIPSF
jgi:hypothetical protein